MDVKLTQPVPLIPPPPRLERIGDKRKVQKKGVNPLLSLFAGSIAGGVEAAVTYPFEFAKTRSQLHSKAPGQQGIVQLVRDVIKSEGYTGLYTGCSTLVVGTAFKAGVRFLTFDSIKNALASEDGKLSPLRGLLAGMVAGAVESIVAVTPTERIKTALIDDAKEARQFKGTIDATKSLIRTGGLQNLYKGLASTTMKQSATSAVRMGSYNVLREKCKTYGMKQNTATTFATGALAGTITVYATQPFDTIKTRSQSAAGASTLQAFRSVIKDSGAMGFWRGSTMRLGRLVLSGGIVFTVYEQIVSIVTAARQKEATKKF
ncbi:Mitochondrial carrier [Glarea lozoyensis ATCC 20868]|uniref:Mitochondrial carrier n=1 Tax=Glarea lozoyensis (strain ATCC 20868 / MF5171) TaxID=1116229 RepID=S3D9R3_GLAL2|nr:Mitochondrial carrier [Glarea lozoyensis ATCC 20868]EPE33864.1 Mitochondrial carrier [Glarea lozoyensis ATCC 20868]